MHTVLLIAALALQAVDATLGRVQSVVSPMAWDNPALHAKGVIAPAAGFRLQIVELVVGRDGLEEDVEDFALVARGGRAFAPTAIGSAANTVFPLERLAVGQEAGEILRSNAIFAVTRRSASRVTVEAGPRATLALLFELPVQSSATALRLPDGTLLKLQSEK